MSAARFDRISPYRTEPLHLVLRAVGRASARSVCVAVVQLAPHPLRLSCQHEHDREEPHHHHRSEQEHPQDHLPPRDVPRDIQHRHHVGVAEQDGGDEPPEEREAGRVTPAHPLVRKDAERRAQHEDDDERAQSHPPGQIEGLCVVPDGLVDRAHEHAHHRDAQRLLPEVERQLAVDPVVPRPGGGREERDYPHRDDRPDERIVRDPPERHDGHEGQQRREDGRRSDDEPEEDVLCAHPAPILVLHVSSNNYSIAGV